MRTKSTLPMKWMIGIVIALTLVVHRTNEMSKNMALHPGSSAASSENFFQFLADFFGISGPNSFFGNGASQNKNNSSSNQNNAGSGPTGGINGGGQNNPNALSSGGNILSSGGALQQREKGILVNGVLTNADSDADASTESNVRDGGGDSSTDNSDSNAENNSENSEINGENPGQGSNGGGTVGNATNNADNNSGSNSGDNSGGNSGSGGNMGTGSTSGSGSGDSGNAPTFINPSTLPTINPIPSDDSVSQSIAKQNQQNDALSSLIASRQALTNPVQQQAQASKYQTVNSENLPAPSTNLPPSDVQAKVAAKQITFH